VINVKKILVAVDFSDASKAALALALALAEKVGAQVHVLHVLEYPIYMTPDLTVTVPGSPSQAYVAYARKQTAEMMQGLVAPHRESAVRFTEEIIPGEPGAKILNSAKEGGFDLIVMGTHGRKGLKHLLLGSVAEWVVRNAPCPVLTTRERER
jgi:nucleotide-binding universal stress UspA family protein